MRVRVAGALLSLSRWQCREQLPARKNRLRIQPPWRTRPGPEARLAGARRGGSTPAVAQLRKEEELLRARLEQIRPAGTR